jgi:hypothetical protein
MAHSSVNTNFETRDERLTTFETETFHGVEFLGSEDAELGRPVQSLIQMNKLLSVQSVVLDTFKVGTDPVTNFRVRNVHELNTDFAAIS